jgi:hypothetical protein
MDLLRTTMLVGLCLTSAVDAAEGRAHVLARGGQTPRPTLAVDNVCAWPNLTVLGDGTIIATIFNQPCHGLCEGDVECWASEDGGRTWALRGTPTNHDPGTNRMNVAAGLAANGDLLVIVSGWSHRPPKGQAAGHGPPSRILAPWVCRSADGGRSWSVDKEALSQQTPAGSPGVPFGDILPGKDGSLRVALYGNGPGTSFVYRSPDDGKTWGEPVVLSTQAVAHEPALLHLGAGNWLAAIRHNGLDLYGSADDAKSWSHRALLTGAQQHPGHLFRLKDSRLLLTYGNRNDPKGVDVRLSVDEGQTWSEPLRVADFQGDGGYPSSVQLPDGQVLTAFYASRTADHPRYHMAVVLWEPAGTTPSP